MFANGWVYEKRFACRNFQISTKLYSKLSYTLCYVYVYSKFKTNIKWKRKN